MTIEISCLDRDGYHCFRCGTPITFSSQWNCHHRLTSALGPDTSDNRISLCGFGNNLRDADGREWCHGWVHQNSREARDSGWIISRHDKRPPAEVPVLHWRTGWVLLTADFQFIPVTREGEPRADGT